MAIVTSILTSMEIIQQATAVYNSSEPLLARFKNCTKDRDFTFNAIYGLDDITIKNVPSPFIPSGSVADTVMEASSWSDAGMTMEYKGKQNNKPFTIKLIYKWITQEESHVQLAVYYDGEAATPQELHKPNQDIHTMRYTSWDTFDVALITTGKLVEMAIIDKDLI